MNTQNLLDNSKLDKNKIKRSFAAAASRYDDLAVLQRRVGMALLEKFPLDTSAGAILDMGCGTGFLSRNMVLNFAAGTDSRPVIALDIAWPMLTACREKNSDIPMRYVCADAENMPFSADSIRQIVSNLALQWCQDLAAVFANCRRMLKAGGQLVFTTFGPATLQELKAAWAAVDDFTHVNDFSGSEEISRLLQNAGFESICIDTAIHQCRYPSVMALMQELKGLGAHNVNLARNRKTTTQRQLQQMINCYEANRIDGDLTASYEIIFVRAR